MTQEEVEKQQALLGALHRLHKAAEEYWLLASKDGRKGPPEGRVYLPDGGMVKVLPPDHDTALDLDLGEGHVQSLEWHAWVMNGQPHGEGYYTAKVKVSNLAVPLEFSVARTFAAKLADHLKANMRPRFRFIAHRLLD
jgi:hypothetical protein